MSPKHQPSRAKHPGARRDITPPSRIKAVILAAGLGTRMKSRTPKVLHPVCGRPMLAYVIDAARSATGEKPLVVYSTQVEEMTHVFADEADFALQHNPKGSGNALELLSSLQGGERCFRRGDRYVRRRATDRAGFDERAA